ncbi:hypothetical protein [Streptosporangium sp. NPDC002721]|uniref:hypothetical protein n=1 Tax=Streptosporangium sp. NPDC002721 TaxID=3366188 RepID=UPI00369FD571
MTRPPQVPVSEGSPLRGALLWGALSVLVAPRAPLPLTAAAPARLDLAVMPLGEPVVVLGEHWLAGEAVAIAVCLVPGLPLGVAAAREFAVSGRGTPLPYDPPTRLVTTGPYGYVRNPMQVSMAGAYLVLGTLDARFLAAVPVVVAYGAGLAAWHEGEQPAGRFGAGWADYRRAVRPWGPRLRPVMPPASVYVDAGCSTCSEVGRWIAARNPSGLRVLEAGDHPGGPRRITYERADGQAFQGMAAVAHVLTHIHLGRALAGWFLLIPGITRFAQLCADAFGYGPRAVPAGPDRPGPGQARAPAERGKRG